MTSPESGLLADSRVSGYSYFTAARPSVSRHIYSIPLPPSTAELDALRSGKAKHPEPTLVPGQVVKKGDKADLASYKIKFSKGAGAYQLDYGPSDADCASSRRTANLTLPFLCRWAERSLAKAVQSWRSWCVAPGFLLHHGRSLTSPLSHADAPVILSDNAALAERDASYLHADITHSRVMLRDGGAGTVDVEVNVMEIRPPMMDESGRTKYPVLFQVSVLASRNTVSLSPF